MKENDKPIDYSTYSLKELEQHFTTMSDDNLGQKEKVLRNWCKKLYQEGKYEEALAKTKTYVYMMLRQRFIYDEAREYFAFKPCSEYLLQELKTGKVSLSPADRFNDPIDPIITVWLKNHIQSQEKISFVCLLQKVTELLRIKCFVRTKPLLNEKSKSLNTNEEQKIEDISPLMWAHYANGHRGVCLKYEIPPKVLKDDGNSSFISLVPVVYKEKIILEDQLDINIALSAKSSDWNYEHEVRMVLFDPNIEEEFPSVEGLKLKAVYLGVNCLDTDERKIKLALINKPVELYRMRIEPANLNRFVAMRIG